jgi:hypothetical protein
MGYTVVSITLITGEVFPQVVIDSGVLARVRGLPTVPFSEDEILSVKQTDEKWDWSETP